MTSAASSSTDGPGYDMTQVDAFLDAAGISWLRWSPRTDRQERWLAVLGSVRYRDAYCGDYQRTLLLTSGW